MAFKTLQSVYAQRSISFFMLLVGVPVGSVASQNELQSGVTIEAVSETPIVILTIDGQKRRFLLDTGASETVIAPSLASSANMKGVKPAQGSDSGGQPVDGMYVKGLDIRSSTGALLAAPDELLVIPIPPLERAGLAGVLSPQQLAQDGCVIVDFPNKRLDVLKLEPECVSAAPAYKSPAPGWKEDGRPYVFISTSKLLEDLPALVDSGASKTSLPARYVIGAPLIRTESFRGVAGIEESYSVVGPVTINLGTVAISLDEVLIGNSDTSAVLGFDVLQKLKIVLWADGRSDYSQP